MLKSLSDVQSYTQQLARALPELAAEIILGSGGVAEDSLAKLAGEIALPPVYLDCASAWHLHGVSLGYFALWPSFGRKGDLIAALLEANRDRRASSVADPAGKLIIVAREEANWICVESANSDHPDVVYYMDAMASPDRPLTEIANSFDKFVILAANLHLIVYSQPMSVPNGITAIIDCCNYVGCSAVQAEFWERKISELLA